MYMILTISGSRKFTQVRVTGIDSSRGIFRHEQLIVYLKMGSYIFERSYEVTT